MTDVIEQLNGLIAVEADGSPRTPIFREAVAAIERHTSAADAKDAEIATLQQALSEKDEEIERLTAAAGAVSAGPSFAEVKADAKTESAGE